MLELLELPDDGFQGICIAPEHPDEPSPYRKPSPRYIVETIARDRLDPAACWMVGDRLSDLQSGVDAGIRAALVRQSEHAAAPEVLAYVRDHGLPAYDSLEACVEALCGANGASP
jgi:D-glycero-D-manno-heptose 1,7-bisphosphate phosphatase